MEKNTALLDAMQRRVVIGDGAMGTMLQAEDLTLDDFNNLEGCNEILNLTRPDVIQKIHRTYFEAGADAVETNTFGCNVSNLADYDIQDKIFSLAYAGAQLARGVADEMGPSADGTPRMVLGSLGPGTKIISLGHIDFESVRDAYQQSASGLIEGGADAILIETCQDLLQVKAAVIAAKAAMQDVGRTLPIITHVTLETNGAMLVGSDITAALTSIEHLGIDMIGMNCATGPEEMSEHLRYLSQHSSVPVSVMPNAGLPVVGLNGAEYPLQPEELADALTHFVDKYKLSLVGGCCGTTPAHINETAQAVKALQRGKRAPSPEDCVASLYTATPLRSDAGVTLIGERTNTNGSKAFREAVLAGDMETVHDIARRQIRDGANMLDLCVDYVGRDGTQDMAPIAKLLSTQSTLPIMLDSTEPAVIEAGLQALGGRCAVNSVNFEEGEGPESRFHRMMTVVKKHGAAVVALTIDEEGQARTKERKVEIAERLVQTLTTTWGMHVSDIILDCLVLPITTGQEEVRRDGIETIEAVREMHKRYPDVHFTVGLSNISFGLSPAARQVLNSVFLNELMEAGLDTAIAHSSKILPMNKIEDEAKEAALDLIWDRRDRVENPLQRYMDLFEGVDASSMREARVEALAALPLMERLRQRIVDGERSGIEEDLTAALDEKPALEIINDVLLEGMKTVGELFGAGQIQLPFVLQSAEIMKIAVSFLEPFIERTEGEETSKGNMLLATVKGDVHDIGKNLVDIILSNNGYDTVNIGIKQPINNIIEAAENNNCDVIGMSGLLVKSTVVMKENLIELNDRGLAQKYPVILGGAALTRGYVEDDLAEIYEGEVYYAKDAFETLRLLGEIMDAKHGRRVIDLAPDSPAALAALAAEEERAKKKATRLERRERSKRIAEKRAAQQEDIVIPERSEVTVDVPLATPPFWGTRIVKGIPYQNYVSTLDHRALFLGQWGLRPTRGSDGPDYDELVATEGEPRLRLWLNEMSTRGVLNDACVVYGYFPAVSEGNDIVILTEPRPDAPERLRFTFPRQQRPRFLCIADFIQSRARMEQTGRVDVLPFQVVTMGTPIADYADEFFAQDDYRNYLEAHGLSVQLTEALAEYWHERIRHELKLSDGSSAGSEDSIDKADYFDLKYRGARFSFGYGACPNLEDREKMMELLEPERAGIVLSEEYQLHPEQSTDAFVLYHPEAKYFNT